MFKKTQAYYDAVYTYKDYRAEAKALHAIIARNNRSGGRDLLDVACGTGKHLAQLKGRYRCRGLDLDEGMLRVARKRLAQVPLHRADMRSFDLGRSFDAVVCLFGSIGYGQSRASLDGTLKTFAHHTKPGGVVIVEPWILRADFRRGRAGIQVGKADGVSVARAFRTEARGATSTLHFHYLVASGGKLHSMRESHRLGLFSRAEYEAAFRRAGLSVRFYKRGLTGRGLFVGRKALDRAATILPPRANRKTAK